MGVEVLDSTLEASELTVEDIFEEGSTKSGKVNVDARRRLEDKLEELRLQRELRDYDYDL